MDLFGAGIGSLLIIVLMNSFGFFRTVTIVSALGTISAIFISAYYKKRQITFMYFVGLILISILFLNNSVIGIIENNFNSYYTSLIKVIDSKNPDNNVKILFSKWDAISFGY